MAEKKTYTHKVTINANEKTNEVKIHTSPSLKKASLKDRQVLVNVLLAGGDLGTRSILGELPKLRPASELEVESKVYVFKNPEADNKLYNSRKAMYETIRNIYTKTLSDLFPDVEYIEQCTKYQQEVVFEMTKDEADTHNEEIEEVVKIVREPKTEEAS